MSPRAAPQRALPYAEAPASTCSIEQDAPPRAKAAQVMAVSSGLLREALRHQEGGNRARAGQLLDRVLEQDPRNLRALIHLGQLRRVEGQLYESLLLYQRALRLDGRNADAHLGLGQAFADLDWMQTAEGHLRLALDASPNLLEAFVGLGRCLLAQGRRHEAIVACEEAILLMPDCREAHEILEQATCTESDHTP